MIKNITKPEELESDNFYDTTNSIVFYDNDYNEYYKIIRNEHDEDILIMLDDLYQPKKAINLGYSYTKSNQENWLYECLRGKLRRSNIVDGIDSVIFKNKGQSNDIK